MFKRTMSIRNKLLLAFLSITLVAVVGTAFSSFKAMEPQLKAGVTDNLKSMVDQFYIFLEANPDMDWAVIKKMCNEQITIGKTGFIFVLDPEGNLLAHKKAEGKNWSTKPHIKKILERKNGVLRYLSPMTKTYKLAAFRSLEERNWIIVAGVFEEDFLAAPRSEMIKYSSIAGLIIIFLAAMAIFLFAVQMTRPISQVVGGLKDIAEGEGDLTTRLEVKSKDEVGELARWFNTFVEKLQAMIKDIAGNSDILGTSSTELSAISRQMSSGAEQTSGKANTAAVSAEEMSSNMNSVASAMEQAATNINVMATSTEEMTATINEIARNTEKASTIANKAVTQTRTASDNVDELGKAAREISKVTETITEISEQTNLLALNATIEAARAGDAGKGFAVVANEIKELARQTAEATQDIKERIEGIQGSTSETVTGIGEISKVIDDVNEIVSTIAVSVEEQSVTTKEIATNVAQASTGIHEVNENVAQSSTVAGDIAKDISEVNRAATEMSGSSSQVNTSSEELNKLAEQLKELVGRFKV